VYGFLAPGLVSDVFMHMDGISIWIPTMRTKKKVLAGFLKTN
jgi:hypothetical protein